MVNTNKKESNVDNIIKIIELANSGLDIIEIALNISSCTGTKEKPHTNQELVQHMRILNIFLFTLYSQKLHGNEYELEDLKNILIELIKETLD